MSQRSFRVCLALLGLSWASAPACLADIRCESWVARLVSVEGRVEAKRAGDVRWQQVLSNEIFCPGDSVRVEAHSRAAVLLRKETMLRLDQGTAVTFPATPAPTPSWLELLKGAVHFISRQPGSLQIKTPFVNAAIEGTEFVLGVGLDQTDLWVLEGRVRASNEAGSLLVASGEAAVAKAGEAPKRRTPIRPRDAVQWALYYPPLIDYRAAAYRVGPAAKAMQEALERYQRGDLPDAIARLGEVAPDQRDASYFTLRASLFLSVGRVDEARSDIAQALSTDARNGTAMALKSVIALARNEKQSALDLARQAVELEPGSPVPRVALSYAQQAHFDIDKAIESAQEAVNLAPEDALAWARLAELRLSTGDMDRSLDAARKAAALDPDLARTQTVLGFAYLTQIRIGEAKSAFEKAIVLDQADPLPRLGLGLAKIREGELEAGRQDIEIATSLDPNSSLIRSYMGKAYFEERHDDLAGGQFAMAKELDPKDPTPWFYDAIRKQLDNRPVEALGDLEQSIELNENRAVYRSRLLLDEDLAVRGVSLARIYDDLGFDQLALVEASKSLNLDPANSSAHRFLSDAYARVSRYEVARVSELFQAQLLQPINSNPVQPQLAETNLNILAGAGPAQAAFSEFTSLFARDRVQVTASGLVGDHHTLADEAVVSGIVNRFSYSVGQFHYETDGFRDNNDVKHDIFDAFVQASLTERLDMQFEYRQRESEQGDQRLRFDASFSPTDRRSLDQETSRLGLHFVASPRADVIASLIYSDRAENLDRVFPPLGNVRFRLSEHGWDAQGQYLFRGDWFDLVAGGGVNRIDGWLVVVPPLFPESTPVVKQHDLYVYNNVAFPRKTIWTLGLSNDVFDSEYADLKEINPKLGLQWNMFDGFRLRAVALKTLKRQLIVDQTLEPTQVAGFNQFFDDANGTRARLYGIGIDANLTNRISAGLETTRRDLRVPDPGPGVMNVFYDQNESALHVYLNWILDSHWASTAGYRFERFEGAALDPSFNRLSTSSVPLVIRYFNPHGFFAHLGANFVRQNIGLTSPSSEAHEEFTVVDAAAGYRLPKRRGVISLEARNLFNKKFHLQDLGFTTSDQFKANPRFIPERTILLRVTINLR